MSSESVMVIFIEREITMKFYIVLITLLVILMIAWSKAENDAMRKCMLKYSEQTCFYILNH